MINKVLGYIGLAIRGRYFFIGEDNLQKIKKGHLVVLAKDASESLKEKVLFTANTKGVDVIDFYDKDTLGHLLNKNQVAILVVTNYSLAAQIKKILK